MSVAIRACARVMLLAVGAALPLGCAAADPEASTRDVQSEISGGQPDSTDSNVFLVVSLRGEAGAALCSASLIAPNLLLTARHCVANVSEEVVVCGQTAASAPFPVSTFAATNSPSLDMATRGYNVSSIAVPSQGSDICGFDLALITLSSNVPASVAEPLVPRIDQPVLRGEVYSAVGYGQDSPGDAGLAGVRMIRSGLKVSCVPGTCGEGVESSEFVGEAGICSGDSGGPALDASGKVVGVVSRSADDCAHPVYGSVASWKDWIISVAQQAAQQGGYTPPAWVTSGTNTGDQGDKCDAPSDCSTGYGCYSPTKQATNAYCAAYCSNSNDTCGAGTHCDVGVGVCVAESSGSNGSSSCAITAPGRTSSSSVYALLALAAGVVVSRRRTRRAAH